MPANGNHSIGNAFSGFLACALFAMPAVWAQQPNYVRGPGFPNVAYPDSQVYKIYSRLQNNQRPDVAADAFHNGYLVMPTRGQLQFYDVSAIKTPKLMGQISMGGMLPHTMSFCYNYPGLYAVMPAMNGAYIMDLTDVKAPKRMTTIEIPGIQGPLGNDDHNIWWVPPHIYVGGEYGGITILDATNLANPTIIKSIPGSELGIRNLSPIQTVGNIMVVTSNEDADGFALFDIGNPADPVLLSITRDGKRPYDAQLYDNKLFLTETQGNMSVFDVTDLTKPKFLSRVNLGGRGELMAMQDGFVHPTSSGAGYFKYEIGTGVNMKRSAFISTAEIGYNNPDFISIFGNMVLVGDFEVTFIPHQAAADKTPPRVNMIGPRANQANIALTSRIGAVFTDAIDLRTVDQTTFIVRPFGGQALPGKYSYQANIVNFSPDLPLLPNTTYELVIPSGGLSDIAGNKTAEDFVSRFSTGSSVAIQSHDPAWGHMKGPSELEVEVVNGEIHFQAAAPQGYSGEVGLELFNLQGKPVESLVRERKGKLWTWTSASARARRLSAGPYTAVMSWNGRSVSKKFTYAW